MKLGIIRCMQTEDYCPGSRDFRTIRERKGAFDGEDDIQLVGFINCGGCPNNCEIICVYREWQMIDSWGNRCQRGEAAARKAADRFKTE